MSEQTPATTATPVKDAESKAIGFWENNSKKILIAGVVVLGVIGGYFGYTHFVQAPKEDKAADAMFKAEDYFRQDSVAKALNGDGINVGFLKIIDRHNGTKAANLAHYYAGVCFLKQGDFVNAAKYLKGFETSSPVLKSKAYGLLGDALAEQGKKDEAVELYKKAGTTFSQDEYFSSEYLFRAGYLLETLGKNKEAIEQYKLIKQKYPTTQRGYDIDKYLARLGEAK